MPLDQSQKLQLKQLGANVRRIRMTKKLTQEKLAELVELNPRTIQKIEAGNIDILATTLIRLYAALKVDWQDLLKGVHRF